MQCLIMSCGGHLLTLLCHISTTLVFSNGSINSCQDMQKQLNEECFPKMFSYFCYQIHLTEITLSKCSLPTVENALFGGSVETSNVNYSLLRCTIKSRNLSFFSKPMEKLLPTLGILSL